MTDAPTAPPLTDTHAHFLTVDYVAAATSAGIEHPDGMPGWPTWSADDHLRLMDRTGVRRSILSISSPGTHFGDDDRARELARDVNDAAARISADKPDRFGFFASLPLPDVEGSVREIERVAGLEPAGFVVETSPGGSYLADSRFDELWRELDRRDAVVFVHPTSPPAADEVDQGLPRPMIEFIFDTTRTFTGLIAARVPERFPRIRWIVSHAGGALPLLVDRINFVLSVVDQSLEPGQPGTPIDARAALRRFWYDTAGFPVPNQLAVLESEIEENHLLYGSDYCWTPAATVVSQLDRLDDYFGARSRDWRRELADNAAAILATPSAARA